MVGNRNYAKKKNLSIQMPNDEKSMLLMHSDIYAGEGKQVYMDTGECKKVVIQCLLLIQGQ